MGVTAIPTDSNGVFSLPGGYLAVDGVAATASQHNSPLEDLEAAMTGRLPRNGTAAMTAPLKHEDGSAAAPSITFGSDTQKGFFKTANGIGVAIGGAQVSEILPGGTLPIGLGPLPWPTATAPTGWLLCNGAAVSRTTYAALFAVIAVAYGNGDGSTTFNIPDMTGRGPVGLDAASSVLAGATQLGVGLGAPTVTLTVAQLPPITPAGTVGITDPSHAHAMPFTAFGSNITGGGNPVAVTVGSTDTSSVATGITAAFTGTSFGSGSAHANVQPSRVFNFIIYAGA